MKLFFKESSAEEITGKINHIIQQNKKYSDMVTVEPAKNSFTVVIKKMGTSKLHFCQNSDSWNLEKEKIALTHRSYKEKVHRMIERVVVELGGNVEKG